MPAYDFVSLPGAPDLTKMPQVDFSWLGNLPKEFQQGQQYGYQRAQQTAFQNGMPTNPDGSIDWNAALQKYMQLGGTPAVAGMAPQALKMDWASKILGDNQAPPGNGSKFPNDGSDTGYGGSTGAPGGAQPAPQSAQQPPTQPSQGSPPPFMGTSRPTGNAIGQAPSIRETVAANGGTDQQALRVAARLGIDPNAPISQQDGPRVGRLLASLGIGQRIGQDAATNQGTSPISTGEVSAQAGETNSSRGVNGISPAAASPGPSMPGTAGGGPSPDARSSVPQPPGGPLQPRPVPTQSYTQANPQGVPTNPYPGVPAATAQGNPNANVAAIANMRNAAKALRDKATRLSLVDPQMAKPLLDQASALDEQAKSATEALQKTADTQNTANIKHFQDLENATIGQGYTGQTMAENSLNGRAILQHPDFYTGIGAETASKVAQFGRMFGLGNGNQADLLGAFNKTTSRSILDQMSTLKQDASEGGTGGSGRIFAQQVEQMVKSSPSPENTVKANLYLAAVQERAGERMQQMANMASDYKIKNGGLDANFEKFMQGWLKDHPLMTPEERADPTKVEAREFKSPQDALKAKVQSGETIRIKTGPSAMDFMYKTYVPPRPGSAING